MVARETNNNNIGKQIPSFKPLSILIAWRILAGTRKLLTTACPKAASVGERIVANTAADHLIREITAILKLFPKL